MSGRKRDYPSGATKRKNKQEREEVIKKMPKISSFFQTPALVSDLDCKGKYYPTHLSYLHVAKSEFCYFRDPYLKTKKKTELLLTYRINLLSVCLSVRIVNYVFRRTRARVLFVWYGHTPRSDRTRV